MDWDTANAGWVTSSQKWSLSNARISWLTWLEGQIDFRAFSQKVRSSGIKSHCPHIKEDVMDYWVVGCSDNGPSRLSVAGEHLMKT